MEAVKNEMGTVTQVSTCDHYLYQAGQTVVYREYVQETLEVPQFAQVFLREIEAFTGGIKKYQIEVYATGTTEFPGAQLGATPHPMHGEWVQLPFFHLAEPVLVDSIAHKAEADIAEAKHLFPKKWQFAPECDFSDDQGNHCEGGHFASGKECHVCHGRGVKVHGSGMDIILVPYPKTVDEKANAPRLADLVFYENTPIETAKYYSDAWERDAVRVGIAMHGTITKEHAGSPLQTKTATEVLEDSEAKNNNHLRLADKFSQVFMLAHRLAAQYLGKSLGFTVIHKFRRDLKLEDMDKMIARVKAAKDAGLPFEMVFSEQCSILAKQEGDTPGYVENIKSKVLYTPFASMSEGTIVSILASRGKDDYDKVFWENRDTVWRMVDARIGAEQFHKLTDEAKTALLLEVVDVVRKAIAPAEVEVVPFGVTDEVEI
jgi:hypothetical protein